jgi:hypothetical protein
MRISLGQMDLSNPNSPITVTGYTANSPSLDQINTAMNQLPLTGQVGETATDQAIANASLTAAGNPATTPNWLAIGGIVGAFAFLMAVKK